MDPAEFQAVIPVAQFRWNRIGLADLFLILVMTLAAARFLAIHHALYSRPISPARRGDKSGCFWRFSRSAVRPPPRRALGAGYEPKESQRQRHVDDHEIMRRAEPYGLFARHRARRRQRIKEKLQDKRGAIKIGFIGSRQFATSAPSMKNGPNHRSTLCDQNAHEYAPRHGSSERRHRMSA